VKRRIVIYLFISSTINPGGGILTMGKKDEEQTNEGGFWDKHGDTVKDGAFALMKEAGRAVCLIGIIAAGIVAADKYSSAEAEDMGEI